MRETNKHEKKNETMTKMNTKRRNTGTMGRRSRKGGGRSKDTKKERMRDEKEEEEQEEEETLIVVGAGNGRLWREGYVLQ